MEISLYAEAVCLLRACANKPFWATIFETYSAKVQQNMEICQSISRIGIAVLYAAGAAAAVCSPGTES